MKFFGKSSKKLFTSESDAFPEGPPSRRTSTTLFSSESDGLIRQHSVPNSLTSPRPEEGQVKVLFLGAGESGKSTLWFQVRSSKDESKRREFLDSYKSHIYYNILDQTLYITGALSSSIQMNTNTKIMIDEIQTKYGDDHPSSLLDKIMLEKVHKGDLILPTFASLVSVWKDTALLNAFSSRKGFHYFNGSEYFFNEETLTRVGHPMYSPSRADVLMTRKKTTGITEIKVVEDGTLFRYIDVGGQKNERKKWKHCMSNVKILVYVVSLADFDETLYESPETNSLKEALDIWNQTINGEFFKDTQIIVVFNKADLLEEKTKVLDKLATLFPEYKGGHDHLAARKFIMDLYLSKFQCDTRFHVLVGSAIGEEMCIELMKQIEYRMKTIQVTKSPIHSKSPDSPKPQALQPSPSRDSFDKRK